MNYWKVILATIVIFGAGVLTGGLLVNFVEHSHSKAAHHPVAADVHPPATNPPPHAVELSPKLRPLEILPDGFLKQLSDDLQLAPDQLDKIKKIIAEGQEQNHGAWTNCMAQMRKVMQDTRHQIREQLTPAQQKQFEDMLKQFRSPRKQNGTNAPAASAITNSAPPVSTNAP